jgi:hypothetical protein
MLESGLRWKSLPAGTLIAMIRSEFQSERNRNHACPDFLSDFHFQVFSLSSPSLTITANLQ